MTNVDALKDLYVTLGGKEDDVKDITTSADMIVALKTVVSALIPTVTAEDNGKVLTVVDGKWEASDAVAKVG